MPTARADTWRVLRTTADLTDDDDFVGTGTAPDESITAAVSNATKPVTAAYVTTRFLGDEDAVVAPDGATFTLESIKIGDLDRDGEISAGDLLMSSSPTTGVRVGDEVRVPLGGAVRWTIRVTSITGAPGDAAVVEIHYREVSE